MRAPSRLIAAAAAVMLAVHALGTIVLASEPPTVAAPEIGPGSISAGLALLAGGVMMFRARRGSK